MLLRPLMLASGVFAGIHPQDYAYGRKDQRPHLWRRTGPSIGWRGEGRWSAPARCMPISSITSSRAGHRSKAENKQIGRRHPRPRACGGSNSPSPAAKPIPARRRWAHARGAKAGNRQPWLDPVYGAAAISTSQAPSAVGQMKFSPNARNVLPGTVVFDRRYPLAGTKRYSMRSQIEECAVHLRRGRASVTPWMMAVGRVRSRHLRSPPWSIPRHGPPPKSSATAT